jgi:hypothetical protein
MHPKVRATGHLDKSFLEFCLQANAETVPSFQVPATGFSSNRPNLNHKILSHLLQRALYYIFKIYNSL